MEIQEYADWSLGVHQRLGGQRVPFSGTFDIIFCRNVMIYFDQDVRKRVVDDIHRLLKPGGYLMVGHAESLTGISKDFQCVMPSVYVKDDGRARGKIISFPRSRSKG